jgi:hypothetical protein
MNSLFHSKNIFYLKEIFVSTIRKTKTFLNKSVIFNWFKLKIELKKESRTIFSLFEKSLKAKSS